jgi:hypothetical protein
VLFSHSGRDVIGKVAEPLTQRHHSQAFTLATPVQQGVKLGAQALTHWGRQTFQFARQFIEGMAQTKAQVHPGKQRPHTAGSTIKPIGESAPHLVRRLLLKGSALKRAVGLSESHRAFGLTVAQMPDNAATDDRGQVDAIGETAAMFFIGQDIPTVCPSNDSTRMLSYQ